MKTEKDQMVLASPNLLDHTNRFDQFKPIIRIDASRKLSQLNLAEVWEYRELLYFLIWRDIKIRYKQTAIGAAWAVLQPLMMMVIFTAVFSHIGNVPSDGLPYPVFTYAALLPWNLFAGALGRCSLSLVTQSNLISKIYFPRLLLPLSGVASGVVDFLIAFSIFLLMMAWYGLTPTWGIVMLPALVALALLTALSVGLWLSAINVRYRDVGHAAPFLIQLWMFASPVAYSAAGIPEQWRALYALNPMVGVIEGFRWAVLGSTTAPLSFLFWSLVLVPTLLGAGLVFFKHAERTFSDVV